MPPVQSGDGNVAETTFRSMIRVFGLIARIMQPYFGRLGISGSQWGLLRTLHGAECEGVPGLRVLELGDRLLVRPPSVSGLVNRLRRLGYVTCISSNTDHRCKEVRLTTAGRELVNRVLHTHGTQIEALMSGLDQIELQQLSRVMNRLGSHLDIIANTAEHAAGNGRNNQ